MNELIITAAICGAEVTKEQCTAVPYTVEETVSEAIACVDAGAAIIHLHVREDDGTPTQSAERFRAIIEGIKAKRDCIVQVSTGGAVGMTDDERLQPLTLLPEMATLDCGTCNFGGDDIFVNTENTIITFARRMREAGVKAEIEVFDKGMIDTAIRLASKEIIPSPMHFNLVMGVNGGIAGTPRDLLYLIGSLPPTSTYTVSGVGKCQLPLTTLAVSLGGHVRVGLEDNVYLSRGVKAESNADFVKRVVDIAALFNRKVATVTQAREILGIQAREMSGAQTR